MGIGGLFPALLRITRLCEDILCRLVSFNSQKNPRESFDSTSDLGENSHLNIFPPVQNTEIRDGMHVEQGNLTKPPAKIHLLPKGSRGFTKALLLQLSSEIFLHPLVILTIFSLCSWAQMWKEIWRKVPGEKEKSSQLYMRGFICMREQC